MNLPQDKINRIIEVAKSFGATRLILFGSAVTTSATANDVDLACDGVTGWDFYKLGATL